MRTMLRCKVGGTFLVCVLALSSFQACEGSKTKEAPSRAEPKADAPAVPTNLQATRNDKIIHITWNGRTVDYDFQDSYKDDAHGWQDQTLEKLRPAKSYQSGYFKDDNALPQPMRFRVRAVSSDGQQNSDWTNWVESNP